MLIIYHVVFLHTDHAEDYFTLENSGVPKVLTAISESSLEIKGNICICIYLVDYLLIIYHVVFLHTDPIVKLCCSGHGYIFKDNCKWPVS